MVKVDHNDRLPVFPTNEALRQILYQELFRGPCKCCGSQGHGILSNNIDYGGQEIISLACPIIEGHNWEHVLRSGLGNMKLLPNAHLFAKQHPKDTAEALKMFRRQGYGRHMNFMPLVDFENDVYQWVDTYAETRRRNGDQTIGWRPKE